MIDRLVRPNEAEIARRQAIRQAAIDKPVQDLFPGFDERTLDQFLRWARAKYPNIEDARTGHIDFVIRTAEQGVISDILKAQATHIAALEVSPNGV